MAFLVAVVVGLLIYGYRLARSIPKGRAVESDVDIEEMQRDLYSASAESLARMLESTDYREAIIAAYALMEESFSAHGFSKSPHQTPVEYMAVTSAQVARHGLSLPRDPLMKLTLLYEAAKFSDHPVLRRHRDEAAAFLRDIRHTFAGRDRFRHG